ncbi:glycosyltransferase family 4 protein [Candidatus Daviesbacteria bacterium]|nr:glycosyltransferase family 4 protein [Candidatus Daviesbacteria bacterium]
MKNIWIDGIEANVKDRLGSNQVAFELLKNLAEIDKKNSYTIILANEPFSDLPKEREGWQYKILKIKKLKNILGIPLELKLTKIKPDVYFSPSHYLPRFSKVKKVATIFDLAFLHFPKLFTKTDLIKLTTWTKYSIQNSNHLITISNFSKKDIIKNYNFPKEKITVAYPGHNFSIFKVIKDQNKILQIKNKYKVSGDFIIFIGTIQPRKNLIRLIESFKNIDNLKLVIVGKSFGEGREGWMFEDILNKPRQLLIEGKIIFTGFIPDEELALLLNGAKAFILPSLYEGFGIPVVDAMACGIPVIVSNVSSLPEIVGNAGLLVDPYSSDQIEQAIRTLAWDKKINLKLSKAGIKQAQKFSWKKMAKKVKEVLETV